MIDVTTDRIPDRSTVPKSRNLAPKMPKPGPKVTPPKMRAPKMPRPVPGGKSK